MSLAEKQDISIIYSAGLKQKTPHFLQFRVKRMAFKSPQNPKFFKFAATKNNQDFLVF